MSNSENKLYHPTGSPLADNISRAVDEERVRQAIEHERELLHAREAAEKKRVDEEQVQRDSEETKQKLLTAYNRLGISQTLRDVRENVWQGGKLSETILLKQPKIGLVSGKIEFCYSRADEGFHSTSTGESWAPARTYYHPIIYNHTDFLEIGISLNKGVQFLYISDQDPSYTAGDPHKRYQNISIENTEDADIREKLTELVVNDSKKRILSGKLPLSSAISRGKEEIKEVLAFCKKNGYKIDDTR